MAIQTKYKNTVFSVGDTVKVHQKIIEGEKQRTQIFEGVVIAIKGRQSGKSFTVRRIGAHNIGVEKIWPLTTPSIEKIDLIRKGHVRRAKLYYLRERIGSKAVKTKIKKDNKTNKSVTASNTKKSSKSKKTDSK